MSYKIPKPSEIQSRLEAESSLTTGTQHASISGTPENMLSRMMTVVSYELYSFIAYVALQILPPSASTEFLDRHASFWLDVARKGAAFSTGGVNVVGTAATLIPAGSIATRPDGQVYTFDEDVTIGVGGTATGSVTAENKGRTPNTAAGIKLTLSSPIVGITSITVDADGIAGGAEIENDTSLLDRVEFRVQNPPQGGAVHDYVSWMREVPGVTRAWAKESEDGVKTVLCTFVMDNKTDTIIPTVGEVQTVIDYIAGKRPAGAHPDVAAPVIEEVDLEIALNPNSVAVQNAVLAELEDFFKREATAKGVTLHLSRLSEAISIGAGESYHGLVSPVASQTFDFGTLPVLGEITWSAA